MEDNQKSRKLVNVIGIPSLLGFTYFGGIVFDSFVTILVILASIEYRNLVRHLGAEINFIGLLLFNLFLLVQFGGFVPISLLQTVLVATLFFFGTEIVRHKQKPLLNVSSTIFGLVWIGIFLGSFILIRNSSIGFELTLCTFLSIWVCDTSAFLIGTRFGKAKLLPSISPKKTWVGAIAGYLTTLALMLIFYNFDFIVALTLKDYLFMSLIYGFLGQLGDLTESMLKRQANIKDSGTLLMGHGGILDRFDSLTLTCPVICIYFNYFI